MPEILTDATLIGAASAAAMTANEDVDTGGWEPGNTDAAQQRTEALGLGSTLEATLSGTTAAATAVAGGYLTALGRTLVDGVTDGQGTGDIGAGLLGVLRDRAQAAGEVLGQIVTAIGQAAMALYQSVQLLNGCWQSADDGRVCTTCMVNEDAGPVPIGGAYPSGDTDAPAHPRCRCAVVPC
jgi:hypothetical protein